MPTVTTTEAPPSGRRTPAWVWILLAVTAVDVTAYVVWTVPGVRPGPAYDRVFDGWVNLAGYALLATLALAGAVRRERTDLAWWLTAAALALRAVGFAVVIGYLMTGARPPYPSLGDAAFVASSLALILAVVLRLRALGPRLSLLVLLDGLAGALLGLGVAVAALVGPLATLHRPGVPHSALVVNAAYPVLDMALLVALAALVATVARSLARADALMVAGVTAYVVIDVVYLVQLAAGSWRPGTWVASASMVATALIAVSVWWAPGPDGSARTAPRLLGERSSVVPNASPLVPTVFVICGLIAIAEAALVRWTFAAVLVFAAATAVAAARLVATNHVERAERDRLLQLASIDVHRFQALVEGSSDFIGMADLDGHVLYLNPGAREMLGIASTADIRRLTVADLVPGDREEVGARLQRVLREGVWSGESRLERPGREPLAVAVSTFVVRDPATHAPFALGTIQRDISARLADEAALRDLAQQRARLLSRLVQAQEDERARIAADVHDDSVQALAAVDLRLGLLRRRLADRAPDLVADLDRVVATVTGATTRLRHLLFDLESPARRTTLADSLCEAADFVFAGTDVAWTVEGDTSVDLPEHQRVTAYRIAKEALVNARKHAAADSVTIGLRRSEEHVVVTVRDDGRGIAPGDDRDRPGHLGIGAMRDRASIAGGVLVVEAQPEGGTEVRLTLRA